MKRTVFVVDDHPMMRRAYASLLGGEPDIEIVGESGSGLEALRSLRQATPDLFIVDLFFEEMNGIEFVRRLHASRPSAAVLVVSMHDESIYAERALQAGAKGYVMKSESDETILAAIRHVLAGHYYLSDAMATQIITHLGRRPSHGLRSPLQNLSDRELEVFELIGRGHSTREIAARLGISPKTVESHRARVKSKLGIHSANELVRRAVQWSETMEHAA